MLHVCMFPRRICCFSMNLHVKYHSEKRIRPCIFPRGGDSIFRDRSIHCLRMYESLFFLSFHMRKIELCPPRGRPLNFLYLKNSITVDLLVMEGNYDEMSNGIMTLRF